MFSLILSFSFSIILPMVHVCWPHIKSSSYHLYSPFLIYTIQVYIWSHPLKSFESLSLYFLSLTLEGLSPYHSFNLLNNCIIDVGLLVSIAYDCLFSKETSLYASHNRRSKISSGPTSLGVGPILRQHEF